MKPSILLFIQCYLPGYKFGGPVQTVVNMVNVIGDRYDFYIVTADRDFGDEHPYSAIRYHEWNKVGKAFVRYLAPEERTVGEYKKLIRETDFDLLYCHSFFDPRFTIFPLFALAFSAKKKTPVLLAPRGEFASGALAHKALKKKIYLFLFRFVLIHFLNYSFHCSSEDEQRDLTKRLGKQKRVFNALDFNTQEHADESLPGVPEPETLKVILLARIDIQKNIDYAIKAVGMLKIPVVFDIFGTRHDEQYARECHELAGKMPSGIRVAFKGAIPHHEVMRTLQKYDLFFLPSKNENFCHVIHEALLSGLPVLTSDRTPWHELESRNAGWEVPLDDPGLFAEKLEAFHSLPPEQRSRMRHAALRYGIDVSNDPRTLQDNIRMFESVILHDSRQLQGKE